MKTLSIIAFIAGMGVALLQAAPVGWNNPNVDSGAAAIDPADPLSPRGSLDLSSKKTTEAEDLFTPLHIQKKTAPTTIDRTLKSVVRSDSRKHRTSASAVSPNALAELNTTLPGQEEKVQTEKAKTQYSTQKKSYTKWFVVGGVLGVIGLGWVIKSTFER
jgi:hypothetical protein